MSAGPRPRGGQLSSVTGHVLSTESEQPDPSTIIEVTEQERDWWDAEELRYEDGSEVLSEAEVDELLG